MKNVVKSIVYLLLLAIAIWWMSANVLWLGDDLDYKYRMKGEIWQSWGWINTFKEFWESQFVHYTHVNGRFTAHTLVQLFNGVLGQQAFAVCNGLVYALFALILAKAGNVNPRTNSAGIVSAITLSVLCFVTKMMPTCQIGYIWAMAANLLWLIAFFGKGQPTWIKVIMLFILGIAVGNWQESISVGVCSGLGFWWLSQFFARHKTFHNFFDWRRSWMLLGYMIGTASNCLAPSTMGRVSAITTPLSDQLMIAAYSVPVVLMLLTVTIILAAIGRCGISFNFKTDKGEIPDGCLVIGLITLLIFNFFIGVYSNRQLFGANLFAAVLLLRALPRHCFNLTFNIIAGLCVIGVWVLMYIGIQEVKEQYDDIVTLYESSEKGTVEYDRTRVMTLGHPLDAKYYEDILGQFNNDLHHSMMKDFKHNRKGKTLKLKPTVQTDGEQVVEYAPGHFYVTVRIPEAEKPHRKVKVYGHYVIANIIEIPAAPRTLEVSVFSHRHAPYGTAVIIPEYPFFRADSIGI